MELKTYITKTQTSPVSFAESIGIGKSMVYYLMAKKRRPSPDLAAKIEKATRGAVSRFELLYPEG